MSSVFNNIRTIGNAKIGGNLVVGGTTTSVSSENVMIADNYIYLNKGYTSNTPSPSGFVVNYDPTADIDTVSGIYTAGVIGISNPTVVTTSTSTFSNNDIIQISGSTNEKNDGIFEVLSHTGNLLTIKGVGLTESVEGFTGNQFNGQSDTASITKVSVGVFRFGDDGKPEVGNGSETPLVFNDIAVESLTSHSTLDNLDADDHTQYMLLGGRSGGQTLQGGTVNGDDFTIIPSPDNSGSVIITGTDGSTSTTTGGVTIAGGVGIAENLYVGGTINGDSLDANTATTLLLGDDVATKVEIADTGVITEVQGPLHGVEGVLSDNLDGLTATTLSVGASTATKVEIGDTGVNTEVKGSLTVTEATTFNGDVTFNEPIIEGVKVYTGAGPHVLATDGKATNTVSHGSAAAVTLPTTPTHGSKFAIINVDTGAVTINRGGSDTIDNGELTSLTLSDQYDRVTLMYVGTNWYIM